MENRDRYEWGTNINRSKDKMAPEKGRRCQVCGGVVSRVRKGGTVDYCNICESCRRVAHINVL